MLICPQCGNDNELGRIFCHGCGTKLDLSSIKPPTAMEKKARRIKRGAMRTLRIAVDLIILGGLILGVTLLCLAPSVTPVQPTNKDLVGSDARRIDLEKLAKGHKSGQVIVTEGQLNAFFNQKPFEKPTGQGIELTPIALRASFSDGCVKVEFLGTAHFGTTFDKNLYLRYDVRPTVTGGKFVFKPIGGWIGKLPIHPAILAATSFFDTRFSRLFGELGEEKALLDNLTAIEVTEESATLIRSVD